MLLIVNKDNNIKFLGFYFKISEGKVKDVFVKQRDFEFFIFSYILKFDFYGFKFFGVFKFKDGGNEKSVIDKDIELVVVLMSFISSESYNLKVLGGLLKNLVNIR